VVEHFDGRLEIVDWANRPLHGKTDERTEGSGPGVTPMSSNHHTS
jgi:hypothetical protein